MADEVAPALTCDGLSYAIFRDDGTLQQLIRDVTATFPAGEVTAILGGSGSGKTTLLGLLAQQVVSRGGDSRPSIMTGRIEMDGLAVRNDPSRVAFAEQNDALCPVLTAREAVHVAASLRLGRLGVDVEQRVEGVLAALSLQRCGDTRVPDLSGGERRRVTVSGHVCKLSSRYFGNHLLTASHILDLCLLAGHASNHAHTIGNRLGRLRTRWHRTCSSAGRTDYGPRCVWLN